MLEYSDSSYRGRQRKPPHLSQVLMMVHGFASRQTLTLAGSRVHLLALSMTILATQQLTSDSIWKLALMDDSSNDNQIL